MFIIYVVDLSTKNKMWRRGLKFLQKLKMQMVGKRKKTLLVILFQKFLIFLYGLF